MKLTFSKQSSLALSLMILSACSSTSKNIQTAQIDNDSSPSVEDILTDRVIAQISGQVAKRVGAELSTEVLAQLVGRSEGKALAGKVSAAIASACSANGIKLGKKYTEAEARTILESVANLNPGLKGEIAAAKSDVQQNAARSDVSTDNLSANVKSGDANLRETTSNLYKGFKKSNPSNPEFAHDSVQAHVTVKHYTNVDLLSAKSCIAYDLPAAKNLIKLWNEEALLAKEIGHESISAESKANCFIQRGAAKQIMFMSEKGVLKIAQANLLPSFKQVIIKCATGPQAFLPAGENMLAQKSLDQIQDIANSRCN